MMGKGYGFLLHFSILINFWLKVEVDLGLFPKKIVILMRCSNTVFNLPYIDNF